MSRDASHVTLPLADVCPELRDDLRFSLRDQADETYCVIEDRVNSRYYQVGLAEYTFLSLLDGKTSLRDALRLTASQLGAEALTESEAETILKWLLDSRLATTRGSVDAERLLAARAARSRPKVGQSNPLLIKLPLFNPQRFLELVAPWTGWAFGPVGLALLVGVVFIALRQLLQHADQLQSATNMAISADNWGWLLLTWCLLKLIHELGHALTCRRFGGHVREAGVMLILLAPIPYVDVTSSWQFPSKWPRIATAAAGMLVELVCAAVAVCIWSTTEDPLIRHHAFNVMLLGSVTTLAFNANFLMRFDGYYILADWLEVPNLYALGQEFISNSVRHCLLGVAAAPARWPVGRGVIIKSYAVASLIWRVIVCACLLLLAERLLFGFGLILSIVALLLWLVWPLARVLSVCFRHNANSRPKWMYSVSVAVVSGCLIWAALTFLPWPLRTSAPGMVRYADAALVRAAVPGLVRTVRVSPGDAVHTGQLLLVIENEELEVSRQDLELSLAQSRLRARTHHRNGHMAAYQAEAATQRALQQRLAELTNLLEQLVVYAPRDGTVVARDLSSLAGRRLAIGTELMTIAAESEKELVISIGQDAIEDFRGMVGQVCLACAYPGKAMRCRLDEVEPRGSDEIQTPALSAAAGGPLAIQPETVGDVSAPSWRYLRPRFSGHVRLTSDQSSQLHAGQLVVLKSMAARPSLGDHCYRWVREWIRRRRGSA